MKQQDSIHGEKNPLFKRNEINFFSPVCENLMMRFSSFIRKKMKRNEIFQKISKARINFTLKQTNC